MEPTQLIMIPCMICACALLAHHFKISPPITFLAGGTLLAFMPWFPVFTINPEHMLILFLPPILMEAAFFTSIRDFTRNLSPILFLAIGLVIFTAAGTAALFVWLVPGATWALGFVLGAVISPPDAAAATSAFKHVRIPRRVLTILEGESLVNDATGIVLYKFAVAAVVAASFSFADAGLEFAWKAIGGVAVGLAVGWVFVRLYPRLNEPSAAILSTFVPPYAAYIGAEAIHASGVLGVVAAGLYIGWFAPIIFTPRERIPSIAVWKTLVFTINALAFMLIGLQLPQLLNSLREYDVSFVATVTAATCLGAVCIRFSYVFIAAYGQSVLFPRRIRRDPYPPWQHLFLISWTGMRGVVTLALALALPYQLYGGATFPYRDLIIFQGVCIILFTLVIQGITLPYITRKLAFTHDPRRIQEEWLARITSARQALARLEAMAHDDSIYQPALRRIRQHYQERIDSLGDGPNTPLSHTDSPSLTNHPLLQAENRIWHEILQIERDVLIGMRREFTISDDVMNDILRDMDLLAARFYYDGEDDIPASEADDDRRMWNRIRKGA